MKSKKTRLKLKRNTRVIIIVIALIVFAVSSTNVFSQIFDKKQIKMEQEVYNYMNEYNLDYIVNIKDNKFIEEESLPKDKNYVSDLVDDLDMDFKYKYIPSIQSKIKYDYKIDAQISASYSDDGHLYEVWNKTYNIKQVENQESNKDIMIDEKINVDFAKYHEEVKEFRQEMGMALEAKLFIKLTVNTLTKINEKEIPNMYVSDFSISLGEKMSKVEGKTTDSNKQVITDEVTIETRQPAILVLSIIMLGASIYAFYFVRNKTYTAYNIRNEFKLELNKILKSCQDRIVVVKNKVDVVESDVIEVKDFVELIKLSEELFKPILYWSPGEEIEEAIFYVISNKIAYRFILK
ncbi:MAG: hypothetical protein J6C46_01020 [Clostridia bacterium]|nr:hypothetical protein [Clostridia bacterium]